MSTSTILVGLAVFIFFATVIIIVAPMVQVWLLEQKDENNIIPLEKKFELRDGARKTWIQIIGGAGLLLGFYLTFQSLGVSQQAQETARETQFSNSFATATDYLSAPDLETRLGGIYALERLAEDSDSSDDNRKVRQVIEVLCAYVRKHSPSSQAETEILPSKAGAPDPPPRAPEASVQAILTVLGRQTRTPENIQEYIYLEAAPIGE